LVAAATVSPTAFAYPPNRGASPAVDAVLGGVAEE
jgi:hypothetical protein